MKQLLFCTLFFSAISSYSQKQFFKSEQKFTENELKDFYSSVSIQDSTVYFKANDYAMYAYDRFTGKQKWRHYMSYKSNTPVHAAGGFLWSNKGEMKGLRLNADGTDPKELSFSIYTKPYYKNDLLYLTGLYDAGNVLAYDINADSVLWFRFIAHGCDMLPYYLEDRIIANAEGSSWIELTYSGEFINKDCIADEDGYTGEKCKKEFLVRTHDNYFLSEEKAGKIGIEAWAERQVVYSKNQTIILQGEDLIVIGKKGKKQSQVKLSELSDEIGDDYGYSKILKADEQSLWIIHNQKLILLDGKGKALKKLVNLESWNPHQAVVDGNNLWVISASDGLLYGLTIE